MKIYQNIEQLPYYNYFKIQESLGKRKPEYNWLYVFDNKTEQPPEIESYLELKKIYENIVYQLPEINMTLSNLNLEIQKELLIYKIEYTKYNFYVNLNKEYPQPKDSKILALYAEYIRYLNNNYTEFNFTVWSIKKDFKEIFETRYKGKGEKFLSLLEKYKTDDFLLQEEIDYYFGQFSNLIEPFLEKREQKVDSLSVIDKHIQEFFKESNNWMYFIFARNTLFNLNGLKCEPKSSNVSFFDEIEQINKIAKHPVKPFDLTVAQYFAIKKDIKNGNK